MSIYSQLLERVYCGAKFTINLKEKTLKINGKDIPLEDDLISRDDLLALGITGRTPWEVLEELYVKYKRSVPNARSQYKMSYFKADDVEDLTDDELAFNSPRQFAQACLEGYVLLAGLSGWLLWENDKHWFYQSETQKSLVLLREWVK